MSKMEKLKKILMKMGRVVVAYSGGLDSAFLLKVAIDTLGRDNVIAVTARSETYPASEYREAKAIARKLGARHVTIATKELAIKNFKQNPVNRCYYCKKELFLSLDALRKEHGMSFVLDGTNRDDLKDVRHGRKAAQELGVRSPLLEAGMGKAEIRAYSKRLRLSTWSKPSFACLASRFPFHSAITKEALVKVGKAEEFIRELGVGQVRVRAHGPIARIEVMPADLSTMLSLNAPVTKRLKALGFTYVALDLAGYRTGSMHETE